MNNVQVHLLPELVSPEELAGDLVVVVDVTLTLKQVLETGQGGQNVLALGLEADLEAAATIDARPVVPALDLQLGCLRLP